MRAHWTALAEQTTDDKTTSLSRRLLAKLASRVAVDINDVSVSFGDTKASATHVWARDDEKASPRRILGAAVGVSLSVGERVVLGPIDADATADARCLMPNQRPPPEGFPWSSRRRRGARPGSCGCAATRYELTDPSWVRRRCSTRSTPLELPRRASPCGTFQLRSLWRQTRRRGGAAPTLTLSESAGRVARTAGRTPSASCGCAARIYRSMRGPWRRRASGPNSHA